MEDTVYMRKKSCREPCEHGSHASASKNAHHNLPRPEVALEGCWITSEEQNGVAVYEHHVCGRRGEIRVDPVRGELRNRRVESPDRTLDGLVVLIRVTAKGGRRSRVGCTGVSSEVES
jgi:hypothetical protein